MIQGSVIWLVHSTNTLTSLWAKTIGLLLHASLHCWISWPNWTRSISSSWVFQVSFLLKAGTSSVVIVVYHLSILAQTSNVSLWAGGNVSTIEWSWCNLDAIWVEIWGSRMSWRVNVVEGRYSSNLPLPKMPSSLGPMLSWDRRLSQSSSLSLSKIWSHPTP